MLTVRAVKKMQLHWRSPALVTASPQLHGLGDLYVKPVRAYRRHIILGIFANTMLPVVLPLVQADVMMRHLREQLFHILYDLEIPQHSLETEIKRLDTYQVAKTDSRVCLGVLNEFEHMLLADMQDDYRGPMHAAQALASIPTKPIRHDSPARFTRTWLMLPQA